MTLVEFLTAQMDALAAAAEAAAELQGSRWTSARGLIVGSKPAVGKPQGCDLWDSESGYLAMERATAEHCALHDPAFVLADITAKRAIIELAQEATEIDRSLDLDRRVGWRDESAEPCIGDLILRQLALPFADRPGYDEAWRPA